MQRTPYSHRKSPFIFAATLAFLLTLSVPALAYSTSQANYRRSNSTQGGCYYSTNYGWTCRRPTTWPKPVPVPTPAPSPAPGPPPPTGAITAEEMQMVNLVNQERAKAGVAPLTVDAQLVQIARIKSQDMVTASYFGHTSPSFGSTFSLISSRGIRYSLAGENLAGAPDVWTAHRALMNSPGHRANILGRVFRRIGVGIARGGPYGAMFTQLFLD